jgi:hypothetical protein
LVAKDSRTALSVQYILKAAPRYLSLQWSTSNSGGIQHDHSLFFRCLFFPLRQKEKVFGQTCQTWLILDLGLGPRHSRHKEILGGGHPKIIQALCFCPRTMTMPLFFSPNCQASNLFSRNSDSHVLYWTPMIRSFHLEFCSRICMETIVERWRVHGILFQTPHQVLLGATGVENLSPCCHLTIWGQSRASCRASRATCYQRQSISFNPYCRWWPNCTKPIQIICLDQRKGELLGRHFHGYPSTKFLKSILRKLRFGLQCRRVLGSRADLVRCTLLWSRFLHCMRSLFAQLQILLTHIRRLAIYHLCSWIDRIWKTFKFNTREYWHEDQWFTDRHNTQLLLKYSPR